MTPLRSPVDQVVGTREACELLGGISRERLAQLRRDPTFPRARKISGSPIWDRALIMAYQRDRTEGTRRRRMRMVLHYRMHGVVSDAAAHAGVSPSTARRWLTELLIPTPRQRDPSKIIHREPDPDVAA